MEISTNTKQIISVVWTMIAFVISIIVALSLDGSFFGLSARSPLPWQWRVTMFFGLFLVIAVPAYLLIALLHIVSKWDSNT